MQQLEEKKMISDEVIDISHYANLLKRSWFTIAAISMLVTAISVLVVLSITPKYTATATLLIEASEKRAISFEDVVGIDATQKEYYQTQFEILKSNQIAEKVIEKLNLVNQEEFNTSLNSSPSFLDEVKKIPLISSILNKGSISKSDLEVQESMRQLVLSSFQERLSINPVRNTQLVKISFTSQDPKLAQKIANAVGYTYIESNLESRVSATRYASGWITGRLAELKQQLTNSEKTLSDYLVREKLIDDSGIDALVSQELLNLTERLAEVRDQRIEIESAFGALKSTNSSDISSLSSIPIISQHPQVIAIRKAELDAQNEVTELSKRYGDKHDRMLAAKARLKSVQDQAKNTTKKLINGIGKELEAVKRQELLLSETIQIRKAEFQELSVKKSRYDALRREVETNRDVLKVFLSKQKETTATEDFNSTNARFTDEALIPQWPSAPKKSFVILMAFSLSIAFSIVMLILIDALKNTVSSISNFEDVFGVTPLSCIHKIKAKRFKKRPLDSSVFFDDKELLFSESFRTIRTSILLNVTGKSNKRILITSSMPSEGKTTVAINTAISFSKVENVLLIDADFRNPSVAERFGFKKYQQGLTNNLIMNLDINDCLIKDEATGITILPAGMLTSNNQELLSSSEFLELMNKLDTMYDRILIDSPPCLPVSDALILGQLADSVIIVVKANETKLKFIKNTISKLSNHRVKIDGFIINQISKPEDSDGAYQYGAYISSE